jgi:hypothetical protein
MEDKELKKRLKKIPDADENGDPIYKIAGSEANKKSERKNRKRSGK